MDKLKMHSSDLSQEKIAKIRDLFPGCVTEARDEVTQQLRLAVDFDQLRQELSDSIVEGSQERYRLDWPGKREALLLANAPIAKTLRPAPAESLDYDETRNLFIEGDNLEVLKLLQENYLGSIKLIYIDPPYNTGSDFIYDDDFCEAASDYFSRTMQIDASKNRMISNPETSGRFHSDWLTMIYSRLRLARNLLCDDGFIVVSIDDVEAANLKKILDDIFGESNELAVLCWDKNRKNDARFFSVGHEYMFVYAKSRSLLSERQVKLREPRDGIDEALQLFNSLKKRHGENWDGIQSDWRAFYRNIPASDPRKKIGRFAKVGPKGPYRDDGDLSWPGGGGPKYEVLHPVTGKPSKVPAGGWCYSKPERFWEEFDAGRVVFGPDEKTLPRQCRYLFESEGQVMPSVFYSYAQTATVDFVELMGDRVFDNPKNWKDLKRIVRYLTGRDDIILDFFAGSASTAHAVMAQNSEDGGSRRFIMAQISEDIDCDSVAGRNGFGSIPDISRERIRRAGKKILEGECHTDWNRDVGFRVLKVDTSNMKEVYYRPDELKQADLLDMVDNVKEGRTAEDLLFQVLVDWGVDLTLPIRRETVQGKTVFFVDDNALVACFDEGVTEDLVKDLAKREALRVVFRDSGFVSDAVKINVEQIFRQLSPTTDIKAI
ncbi:DNA methyltransferase [Ensifer adhaerens]|uniref:site-specific DNA-methyltransferase (adenine-specific) n=1 Tax=Ensifer adhaerens TaxID=106592 RepID=A0A0L8BQK8_ENSAD|nr:site-specific DNA-methyltransferase [Ensifer adhaerens]KOF17002.1 DNA methyltransferase [Ensifer adhaerens]